MQFLFRLDSDNVLFDEYDLTPSVSCVIRRCIAEYGSVSAMLAYNRRYLVQTLRRRNITPPNFSNW